MQDVWLQLEVAPDPLADGDEVPAPRLRGAQTLRDRGAAQRQEGPREVCQGVQVGHTVDYLQNHMRRNLRYILSMSVLSQIFCQMGGKCIFSHFKL